MNEEDLQELGIAEEEKWTRFCHGCNRDIVGINNWWCVENKGVCEYCLILIKKDRHTKGQFAGMKNKHRGG